ncbi:MAG: sigma-54 dependent transcriptional regulator [Planctomycetota bacterium]
MPGKTRILIVDDDPIVADSLADVLRDEGHDTATAHDGREALALIDEVQDKFNLLITDLNLPRCGGMELLKELKHRNSDIVPIVITGFGKIETAVHAVKLGAADYLTKPLVDDELRLAVSKAANQQALLAENQTLKDQLSQRFGMSNLVGGDYRMQKVYDLVESVADSKTTVLISGESGTGKSMVGRAIHAMSERGADRRRGDAAPRAKHKKQVERRDPKRRGYPGGPFVTFACGSIPETLLESELFGHTKGAFTGADFDKPGKILAADGGTLFIDEINSATPALQLKLLRVLQEKAFEPVGSTQTMHVDVRFIIATNQDLKELVEAGQFREDLYYRINVVNLKMPALRERPGDIPLLAEHFLEKYTKETGKSRALSSTTIETLQAYDWPGNVRELENAIERAVVLSKGPNLEPDDLPEAVLEAAGVAPDRGRGTPGQGGGVIPALADGWTPTPLVEALQEPERQIVLAALEANDWNRQETARQLDINRTTLYKKIKQFGLDEPS